MSRKNELIATASNCMNGCLNLICKDHFGIRRSSLHITNAC